MEAHAAGSWRALHLGWGTPETLFAVDRKKLEAAFLAALLLHAGPFGILWKHHLVKKSEPVVTLQNVDLIEPEPEHPVLPPAPEVQKPKSALDFLKMALPIFRKPAAPEIREVLPTVKTQEPKLAEPEKLMERKAPAALLAPEIRLDAQKMEAPRIADISRLPSAQRADVPRTREPALNLEEVGRRAVAPQTPALSLDRSAARERVADISSLPRTPLVARSGSEERLVERQAPAAARPSASLPLGYERRGAPSVSLDQPREVARSAPKPEIEAPVPKASENQAVLSISKERVRITGPLSSRKVLKSAVPGYPGWARAKNIEADVAIRFTVSPDGAVQKTAVVQRTSGYPELDRLALDSLMQWKFSPLSGSDQDQWGVITFRFLLD